MDSDEQGMTVGYELPLITSAVTPKYVYISASKMWADVRRRHVADDFKSGVTLEPPFSQEIQVGFVRPGKEMLDEPLRENAITLTELTAILTTYVELVDNIQSTVNKGKTDAN